MLQISEIQEVLKAPINKQAIQQAIQHEYRLRFHCETVLSNLEVNRAATDFLMWVQTLIPADKYRVFLSLFRYPNPNLAFTSEVFAALEKIFDGQNPVFQYQFQSSELELDWNDYRTGSLKEPSVWQNKGFATMKTAINSVIIVDVPEEQNTIRPEPYFYFLDISSIVDFKEVDGVIEWIAFEQEEDRLVFFDDTFYRVFNKTKNESLELISENSHGLGFCPARFFWTASISEKKKSIKKSPLTDELTNLDWLLFFGISKKHLDLYAPYPIYSGYESECDYDNENQYEYCKNGFLRSSQNETYLIEPTGALKQCPVCSRKRLAGVGSFVEVPVPSHENGNADLRNPISITTVDEKSLKYNTDEVERIKREIFKNVTGFHGELTKKAVNELQIEASFEARKNVLIHIKKQFEQAQKWVDDTICKLRYGALFLNSVVNYGTEFYLENSEKLLKQYNEAKKQGADDNVLDMLQNQFYATKYRNNPEQQKRINVLLNLEPFRHLSKKEVNDMFRQNQIGYDDFIIKSNFSSFMMRFERENINIVEFGSSLSFDSKINSIYQALKAYAQEMKQSIKIDEAETN